MVTLPASPRAATEQAIAEAFKRMGRSATEKVMFDAFKRMAPDDYKPMPDRPVPMEIDDENSI